MAPEHSESAPALDADIHALAGGMSNCAPALRACWHPIARSVEVDETPRRFWLVGEPWIAVRLDGELAVLADRCPHRFTPLSAGTIDRGEIVCAYHGWRFDAKGQCQGIPSLAGSLIPPRARARAPFAIEERYGLVFVAIDEPIVPLPDLEIFEDHDRSRADLVPFEGPFSAALLIDNQLDIAHFPFVHRSTFGSEGAKVPPRLKIERDAWGFTVRAKIPVAAAHPEVANSEELPKVLEREMTYRYLAPFHLELRLDYPLTASSNVIVFWVQPETADRARMYVTMLLQKPGGYSEGELKGRIEFEYRVIAEDLELQSRFDVLTLPLELTAECHVNADRATVEYRRILAALHREHRQGVSDTKPTLNRAAAAAKAVKSCA